MNPRRPGGPPQRTRVGELRPTQVVHAQGIGAIVELPHVSVIVMGMDDWFGDASGREEIPEDRLVAAVRERLDPSVKGLVRPPSMPDNGAGGALSDTDLRGVPVAPFPRWLRCPACALLAPIEAQLFTPVVDPRWPDRYRYEHDGCPRGRKPVALPARFLLTCRNGHLDDFPWIDFAHVHAEDCGSPLLELSTGSAIGEASDLFLRCRTCMRSGIPMSLAFGKDGRRMLPRCRGRRPHLRDFDPQPCTAQPEAILLGASNLWFGDTLTTLALPVQGASAERYVDEHWTDLHDIEDLRTLERELSRARLPSPGPGVALPDVVSAIEARRGRTAVSASAPDLRLPEWKLFADPARAPSGPDFEIREVRRFARAETHGIASVVAADRLREVSALVGFVRIEPPDRDPDAPVTRRASSGFAPIARGVPSYVPACEVRGEGVFLRFDRDRLAAWEDRPEVRERVTDLQTAHVRWRRKRGIEPADQQFPGARYVLLHTFSHALLRTFALECGYGQASLRERIYARRRIDTEQNMSGILLYTAAPDADGTLGGLVALAEPSRLGRFVESALEQLALCTSDPLCAEHRATDGSDDLHAAACHACLFAPETSCERGNRYLDRALAVDTVQDAPGVAFFQRGAR